MFEAAVFISGHVQLVSCCSLEQSGTAPKLQAIIVLAGMMGSAAAFLVARRAYKQSFKHAEPDMELVRRFVESAPPRTPGRFTKTRF